MGAPSKETPQVPLVTGLTVMSAVASSRLGDYETVKVFSDLTATSAKVTISGEAADDSGEVREIVVSRTLRREDMQNATTIRRFFHESDDEQYPGTVSEFSSAMIEQLRATGRTNITYLEIKPAFGGTAITRTMSGSLARVGTGPVDVTIQVNGQFIALRALHVIGRLADHGDGADFDYVVVDDPENPLVLRGKGPGFSSAVTRIEFPQPSTAETSLERALSKNKRAIVYGIYFEFNRADIRPVSEPVLREIAGVLKKNPDWRLSITGHTDNIGGDAANLELSRRRAQSVRTALVNRYGIDAGRLTSEGVGASQPQATNDTPEGRARNRRVELTRP